MAIKNLNTLGDMLQKRYVADFVTNMQGLRDPDPPTQLRCAYCKGFGVDPQKMNKDGSSLLCKPCNGRGVPPIPWSELETGK
jgi:hypothetical protein